jgi:hypothetical protein
VSGRTSPNPRGAWGETLILGRAGRGAMVNVDSALLSVQERDNWRRRMEVLERSLSDVRERRRRLEFRLRRVRKELTRLRVAAEALLDLSRPTRRPELVRAPSSVALHNR